MSSAKQNVFDQLAETENQKLRAAIAWKYGLSDEQEIGRKLRQLRQTDKQDLLWEYEDSVESHYVFEDDD